MVCHKWSTSGEPGPLVALVNPILAFPLYPPVAPEVGGGSLGHRGDGQGRGRGGTQRASVALGTAREQHKCHGA